MRHASSPFPTTYPTKPWYRHTWPWLLMLGPVAVILAGTYTIWLAFSQPDALVVDDYYKQGKAINMDLRRDQAAANLVLVAGLRYDAARGILHGSVVSKGAPLTGPLQLRLIHSTQPTKDIKLVMHADQRGSFQTELPMLDIARWQVLLEDEQRVWRLNGEWTWPAQKNIQLQSAATS